MSGSTERDTERISEREKHYNGLSGVLLPSQGLSMSSIHHHREIHEATSSQTHIASSSSSLSSTYFHPRTVQCPNLLYSGEVPQGGLLSLSSLPLPEEATDVMSGSSSLDRGEEKGGYESADGRRNSDREWDRNRDKCRRRGESKSDDMDESKDSRDKSSRSSRK